MKRLFIIPLLFITFSLFAAPIGEQKAREIALQFFASQGTRLYSSQLAIEWAGSDIESTSAHAATRTATGYNTELDESAIYIYNRLDKRGFVVVAGDDTADNAILAGSFDNNFDSKDMPDGAKAILQGWCKQIADGRASNKIMAASNALGSSFGDIICEYKTAVWGQSAPFNGKSPTFRGSKAPSGCVATAAAIICKYWEWPDCGVGTTAEYKYSDDNGQEYIGVPVKLGHPYDYSLMKMDYRNSYTKAEGDMVATLLYDLASAFKMHFGIDGSGANTKNATQAMMEHFKYSKGALFLYHTGRSEAEWNAMLQENLKDYGPVFFSGRTESSGHAFVLDGCTDKGYFRINYGWNGNSNGYYLLPNIQYYKNQGAAFYMKPDYDGTSTYRDYLALTQGTFNNITLRGIYTKETEYEVNKSFTLTLSVANKGLGPFSGKYCIAHCDKDGDIKDILWEYNREESPLSPNYRHAGNRSITIEQSIEVGDRLRMFYQSPNSNEWIQILRYFEDEEAHDEVLLKATPAEVAKSLKLSYNKEDKLFTFTSEQAIQYSVTNSSGSKLVSGKVASFTPTEIDATNFEQGEYTFSFASGGEPYTLTVVL